MRTQHIVENDLERPWPRDAHTGLYEHGDEHDDQRAPIRADQATD
jgi:hypothetical protein